MKEYTNRKLQRRHRFIACAAAGLLVAATVDGIHAQKQEEVPAGPLTLEQVLKVAESRSETIAISRAGVQRAVGEQIRARSGHYPQLSAAASYDRALASEFEGIFDDQALGDADNNFADLPFGRKNTWRAALVLSQNIYSGGRLGAQRDIALAGHQSAVLGVSTATARLLFDVTQSYYEVALSERLVRIAEATLEQANATLRQTQAGFDAGTQPEFELVRARVTRDSQTPVVIRQRVNREVALLRLKQLLDLPQDYDLQLADALEDPRLPAPPVFAPKIASMEASIAAAVPATLQAPADAVPNRTVVNEALATVRLQEAVLRLIEAERKPSVSLNSTYARLAYPTSLFPGFDRSNWAVGATLSLPILTGGRQRGDEQVARADVEEARQTQRLTQELADLDSRAAWAELLAARAAWEATAGTVQQATRAYEIADVRFQSGVSTQLELSDARLLLQESEANRAIAARDLQVARARMALLPDLPIGTTVSPIVVPLQRRDVQVPVPRTNSTVISNVASPVGVGGFQGGGFQTGTR